MRGNSRDSSGWVINWLIGARNAQHDLPFGHTRTGYRRTDAKLYEITDIRHLLCSENDALAWESGARKFHRPDCRQEEKRALVLGVTRSCRDASDLRQRFRQDHTGHERIAGKMPGKHRIVGVESRRALSRCAGLATEQLAHKDEWRAVR